MSLQAGTHLGPYKIGDQLGAGGMGEVYAAIDTRLDRVVAIKVLPEHLASDPERRERFEREARAVSSLNHPYICTLFDVGEQDGIHYLVMELVEGETLRQRLEKGRLPLDRALEYAIQIADALDKAHRQGVIHRDLKPGNIMLTKSGPKLLDFGLARLGVVSPTTPRSQLPTQDEAKPLTAEGTIMGTLQYMAPEQLEGKETDARTDVFAFGALVYEMVTGNRAFAGASQASLIGAILRDDPQPMARFETRTPASLEHVIGRCLRKDPDRRWQTATDLMHELTWVREAEPAALEAPEPVTRRRLIAVALTALVAGALITAVVLQSLTPSPAGEVTRLTLDVHEGANLGNWPAANAFTFGRPLLRTFALSPDGGNLVYVGNDGDNRRQLYLRPLDQDQAVPIPGTEGAGFARFSPDGQSIGFFFISNILEYPSGELKRVPVNGGAVRTISITGLEFLPADLSWTDDDRILLSSREGVLQVSANGGGVTHLTTHDRGPRYVQAYPELLPGGTAVLYAEGPLYRGVPSEEFNVIVESLETRDRIVVVEGGTDPAYLESGHIAFVRSGTLVAVPFDTASLEVTGDPVVVLEDVMQAEGVANTAGNSGIGQYSVSRSGTLAYLPGGIMPELQYQLNSVDLVGNAEPVPLPPARYVHPRFSPDGTRLAYIEGRTGEARSIWVYDMDLGVAVPLPKPSLEHENQSFAWSPDGTEIVFNSHIGGDPLNLYLTAAAGSGEPQRLTESDANQFSGSWSPNGVLAFLESGDIWILSMDGDSEPAPFRETPFAERFPAFSPDGNWLAYVSDETGRVDVHVRPFPAGEPAYQVSNGGGQAPVWSPNGEQLFYFTFAEEETALQQRYGSRRTMVVDVNPESTFTRSRPRILFEGPYFVTTPIRSYDVSPAGDRFVLGTRVDREPEPATRIHIVVNWFEELKERVPVP